MPAAARTARAGRAGAAPLPGRRRGGRLFAHELGALLGVAGPIIVAQLGNTAMNTTDTLMVGPLGANALAAAGLGSALYVAAVIVCTGVLWGMGPLVSQAFGAGERPETRRVLVQGLWLAAALAVPLTVYAMLGGRIALALGQDPEVAALAGGYLLALAPGALPLLLFTAFRQYLEGMGITRPAMLMTFLGVAVNVAGNAVFIHGVPGYVPAMGVAGSGLATSLVRWAMLVGMAWYVFARAELRPGGVALRPEGARLARIATVGAPIGLQVGAEIGLFAFAAVMMGWLGPVQLAAHQVAINIASTTFMVAMGVSLAGSVRVGQHVGAGRTRAVHRAAAGTYVLTLVFMGACALAFLAFPRFLMGLYTSDARILELGTALLFLAALFQLFDGAQVAGLSVLRGAADTRVPMAVTLAGYWGVGFPVAYYLGFRTEMEHLGIWTGLVVGLAVVAVLLAWRVRRVVWAAGPIRRVREAEPALAPAGD